MIVIGLMSNLVWSQLWNFLVRQVKFNIFLHLPRWISLMDFLIQSKTKALDKLLFYKAKLLSLESCSAIFARHQSRGLTCQKILWRCTFGCKNLLDFPCLTVNFHNCDLTFPWVLMFSYLLLTSFVWIWKF